MTTDFITVVTGLPRSGTSLMMQMLRAGSYRVIFMEHAMSENLASQTTMLEGLGRQGAGLTPERLGTIFGNQLSAAKQWLAARDYLRSQYFEYKDIVEGPAKASAALNAFLGDGLDEQSMAATVKPELYRQR